MFDYVKILLDCTPDHMRNVVRGQDLSSNPNNSHMNAQIFKKSVILYYKILNSVPLISAYIKMFCNIFRVLFVIIYCS